MDNLYKHITLEFDQAQQPRFEEKKGKNYVEFGERNNYPNYLIDLYNESPKHGAIVRGKSIYITGKGFEDKGIANSTGESWNDLLKKCVMDDELFRGYYLQVIWNRLKQVSEIYHIEFQKVRVSKDLSCFYVKNDWQDNREKAREYEAFNVNNPIGSQIYYYKDYNPSSEVYPLPSYFQGLNYIESDIQVSRHILGNAKRQFVANKLIQLNNGDPIGEENKGEVERGLLKKFSGSEGARTVIMFNKSKENSAEIIDLGTTSLTKEDFTNVNGLIQTEIFSCHQITSPVLFGISTPGALGQRNEIRDAYEVFSNTYVNNRQQELEVVFTKFRNLRGEQGVFKIIPVEPLKFEFSEAIIAANLTQDEIRGLMGKEPLQANAVTSDGAVAVTNAQNIVPEAPAQMNDAIKNLSGRQHQNVMRIVRQFGNGKLTKAQASLMLKNGFGFTDSDVDTFLDDSPITEDEIAKFSMDEEEYFIQQFAECGEDRNLYDIVSSRPARLEFAESLNQLEANVLDLITKDKRITPEVLATTLKKPVKEIQDTLDGLTKKKILNINEVQIGQDKIIERIVDKTVSELPGKDAKTTELLIRYTYEGAEDSRNRPFCAKMLEISRTKMWSRSEIENISMRLGYSVWDRRGGWYTIPNSSPAEHRPFCRHDWVSNIVTKK